jgi:hypothetical protein
MKSSLREDINTYAGTRCENCFYCVEQEICKMRVGENWGKIGGWGIFPNYDPISQLFTAKTKGIGQARAIIVRLQ